MKKVRVVQIGVGHDHAADIYQTLRALPEEYDIAGVCEPDETLRAAAALNPVYAGARWLTLDEALSAPGLDAAIVESGEKQLVGYAQACADRGLPVHMDKPCGEDCAAFAHLVGTLRARRLPLHVGYMYRYNPAVRRCLELKASGALGEIFSVEAQMSACHSAEKRAWLSQFEGGMMFFLGCHLVDLVYTLQGEPEEVVPFNASTMNGGVDSLDYAFALFRYKNGVSFVRACASEVNGFDRRQLAVCGTKGTVVIQPLERRTGGPQFEQVSPARITLRDEAGGPFSAAGTDVVFGPFGRYLDMMRAFARIARGEAANPFSYDHELAVQRLLLAACGTRRAGR